MKSITRLFKIEVWRRPNPRRKKPEEAKDFLERVIRLAAARASIASWGQPFEAVASWILLGLGRDDASRKKNQPE